MAKVAKLLEIKVGGGNRESVLSAHLSDGWYIVSAYGVVDPGMDFGGTPGTPSVKHFVLIQHDNVREDSEN